jgi:serine/threonine-protein kinase RsbW
MHLTIALTLPTRHEFVRVTRRAIAAYLERAGVSKTASEDVALAVGEACTNAVQHAFPGGEGTFDVEVVLTDDQIIAEVRDAGVGFEAFDRAVPSNGQLAVAGRGLEIMRRLVQEVEVLSPAPEGGTRVRFRQPLRSRAVSS